MRRQDALRLLRIDEQLLECEDELKRELEKEATTGQKLMLMSRHLKTKYERLNRMRNNLIRSINNKVTRQQTYNLILEQKKKALDDALYEQEKIEQRIMMLGAVAIVNKSTAMEDFKIARKLLNSQKLIVANKQRAIDNWLDKKVSDVPITRSSTMKSSYSQLKERIVAQDVHVVEDSADPMDQLRNDPNWNVNPAVNKTTIDMLTRPEEIKDGN